MDLREILDPRAVKFHVPRTDKKRTLQELAHIAAQITGIPAQEIFDGFQAREALGSTGVGRGIALPHARCDDIDQMHGIFLRLQNPVAFGAIDRQPVDPIFALLVPTSSGSEFLTALAHIARTFRDEEICRKLRANDNVATLYTILMMQDDTPQAA